MLSSTNSRAATLSRLLALSVGAVTLTSALSAQTVDPRWTPWLGCWAPQIDARESDGFGRSNGQLVCVVPSSTGNGVIISTVINGKTVSTERLDVTGSKVSKTRDGCDGWEQASWAPNAHRVTMRSEFTCAGGATHKSSGIFAISPAGEFMQVHGVNVSGSVGVRVALFEPSRIDTIDGAPAYLPPMGFAAQTSRIGASSEVLQDDVLDVAKKVDASVAEAWLTEVGQGFVLDGKSLMKLADGGLPPRMLDLMVALSNPKSFVVSKTGNRRAIDRANTVANSSMGYARPFPIGGFGYSPLDFGMFGMNGMNGMNGFFDGFGMGRFGAFNNGFGWGNGFGNPYNFGFGGFLPQVVIVNRGDYEAPPPGRAINGAGYTQGRSGSSGGASSRDAYPTDDRTRASAPSSSSGGGYNGGSSSSGSSSGSSSSSGASSGGGGRTAKPRPPGS